MAQRKKSEIEFIQDTFCPQVAVLCSYDAEVICRKNSLTFVELVQPFCRFNGESKFWIKFKLIAHKQNYLLVKIQSQNNRSIQ